jgi:hypothetical protein
VRAMCLTGPEPGLLVDKITCTAAAGYFGRPLFSSIFIVPCPASGSLYAAEVVAPVDGSFEFCLN